MGKRKGSVDQSSSRHVKLAVVEKQLDVETPYLGKKNKKKNIKKKPAVFSCLKANFNVL
jgi:hypothetical protein